MTAPPGWWARHRATLLLVLAGLLAVSLAVLLGGGPRTSDPLDPANPDPEGARAVARVLEDRGVEVEVVRDADDLDATRVDAGTALVVTRPELLGESTARRLLDRAGAAPLVVVGAGPGLTTALGSSATASRVGLGDGRAAGCTDPLVQGLEIAVDEALAYTGEGCFATPDGAVLVREGGLVLFGAAEALTNEQVLRADNAAVALRLLGQRDRLVWYVPSLADLAGDDGVSLQSLLPRWLRPGLLLLALVMGAVVLWRGRRLGPLATEPLPVVVRAIETTRSRGRLYRRAGDRGHAAAALRRASRDHAAERLRLGATAAPPDVVRTVSRQLDLPVTDVEALLGPEAPAPTSDAELIALATRLAELDREVRRR